MHSYRSSLSVLLPALLLSLASAQYPGATPPPNDLKRGFDAITIPKAQSILTFLATQCDGRGTGQPGFQKAAEYVAKKFKAAGLKPMGDNGTYFQHQTFYRSMTVNPKIAGADGKVLVDRGLVLNPTKENIDVTGPVMVVRAINDKMRLSEADAAKLDGKIVILIAPAGRSSVRSQVAAADTKALLTVVDGNPIFAPSVRRTPGGPTSMTVSGRIAKKSLGRLGKSIETFAGMTPVSEITILEPSLTLHVTGQTKSEDVKVPNVVGLLEGSDPVLKNEYIGIGGHLDHLGVNQAGVVYPGADDDGSGSTSVMLIADAMKNNRVKPRRSILFMTFFGEEMGLLGSSFLTDHPPVPLDKMVSELQMDMVARDSFGPQNGDPNRIDKVEENMDTIRLVGSKRISTDLDHVIQDVNKYVGFRFKYDAEDVYTRSDHYNFAKKGIPIAFLFDGFTPSYHQPTDTVDTIDFKKLTSAAKLYYLTALAIANTDQAPRKDVGK
ncbi:M28 family peptidase [Fimbriimonas ginsengisoli]|uniref:Putative aminopeptidase n=1 Tax=Fimbriimonas ginsengisoli Gsoil 348 TaxID=661478 RepID=A0A068NMJ3_FIMGI|nr:M28 family peptidase [Fimbriimonas ginsengisoli]AIE83990.1 putative aminopeptidase [Fimbriimonas ginsengisoli Gsoil 348]